MTLDPHHFQQWDRYHRSLLHTRLQAVAPHGWGVTRLVIDEERLANGELVISECVGVMPDGLTVDVPRSSPIPQVRNVQEHFPPSEDRLRVLLAVPDDRQNGRNVELRNSSEHRDTRFYAENLDVQDENTGTDERSVRVATANVQIRFSVEDQQGYSTLPLAEIRRTSSGFTLDDAFLPPCIQIGASSRLVALTQQVLELLVSKSNELSERREDTLSQRELSPSDIMTLNLLGTINRYIPQLKQLHADHHHHPRNLFRTLTALAGELTTYLDNPPVHPQDLPTYEHDSPSEGFRQIDRTIRQMIGEATFSEDYEHIELEQDEENLLVASIRRELLEDARLLLVASGDQHSAEKLENALPGMLRVASPETIDAVIKSYTQALNIEPCRRVPTGVPVDEQAAYFRLEKQGPYWESILEEESIAIFLPSDFHDAEIEMMAAL